MERDHEHNKNNAFFFYALRCGNYLICIENPELEILEEAKTAMSCFILFPLGLHPSLQ